MSNFVTILSSLYTPQIHVKMEETKTISQFFSKKQACKPEEQKHEKTAIKEELEECIAPKSEEEEPRNRSTLESTIVKDEASVVKEPEKGELAERIEQKTVKEEPCSQEKSVTQMGKSDTQNADHAKPSAKESDRLRLQMGPVKKRRMGADDKQARKGVDDKQPTLFSYFGKN